MSKISYFIFHGSLRDFLPANEEGLTIQYEFFGRPAIKDAIEAQGVPHPEVGDIVINGTLVDLDYKLNHQDQVEIYPIKISNIDNLPINFIVDSHLGKLSKDLRVLGFDCLYDKNYTAQKIVDILKRENRIVLTRNIGLLKDKSVIHGYWLRSQEPHNQLLEVINQFGISNKIAPFTRCRMCNGLIKEVPKKHVEDLIPQMTRKHFQEFFQCEDCKRIYWKGSHYDKMLELIDRIKKLA